MNLCAENGLDLGGDDRWRDIRNLAVPAGDCVFALEATTR